MAYDYSQYGGVLVARQDKVLTINRSVLSQAGPLPASHPSHGQVIVPGHIYVAPPDRHMRLIPGFIHLDAGPKMLRSGGCLEHVGSHPRLLQRRSVRSGSERRLRRPRGDRAA